MQQFYLCTTVFSIIYIAVIFYLFFTKNLFFARNKKMCFNIKNYQRSWCFQYWMKPAAHDNRAQDNIRNTGVVPCHFRTNYCCKRYSLISAEEEEGRSFAIWGKNQGNGTWNRSHLRGRWYILCHVRESCRPAIVTGVGRILRHRAWRCIRT